MEGQARSNSIRGRILEIILQRVRCMGVAWCAPARFSHDRMFAILRASQPLLSRPTDWTHCIVYGICIRGLSVDLNASLAVNGVLQARADER